MSSFHAPAGTVSLITLGLPAGIRKTIAEAAAIAFDHFTLNDVAADCAPSLVWEQGPTLLLLGNSQALPEAFSAPAKEALGPPRWTVVNVGDTSQAEGSAVSPPHLAELLKTAARAHRLERENARLRGDLSTVGRRVSHDLRSPLSGIYTSCEAINEILADETGPHVALTRAIVHSSDEILQVLERVSFVLKATADPIFPECFSMGEGVSNALQSVESALARKNISVTKPVAWPEVLGVPAWIEVVWLNLLRNAVQASPSGSSIEVAWTETATGHLKFWVENNGEISPQRAANLFYPFDQLHHVDAPRGLGLPISKRLVDLQRGDTGWEQTEGRRVRFFFTLPQGASPS